jgi:cytochrome c biogenesis protein CcmG/thiol:disulfide interchange protein DsbE
MSNRPRKQYTSARPARPTTSHRPRPIVFVVAGAIGLAALIAVLVAATSSGDKRSAEGIEEARPVTVAGSLLATYAGEPDPAKGAVAPTLTGSAFDGTPLVVAAVGKPTVVAFVAHWCPHCRNEVPVMVKWLAAGGQPANTNFFAVATSTSSSQPNYPPSEWLSREGWTVPTMADDSTDTAAHAFGVSAFPFFVALDANGHVVARTSGELTTEALTALFQAAGATS